MGTTGAMGMAEAVNDGLVSLRQAISWHLTSNHYPPLPSDWVDSAIEAIDAFNEGESGRIITLPDSGHFAEQSYPAWDLLNRMHLSSFLSDDDEYDDEVGS